MKNPLNFYKYLPFFLRKRFKKKYIVIESDDWGMMGSRSKEGVDYLAKKYGQENFSRWTTDALETPEDLERLYALLDSYKSSFERPPMITTNFITHNIDYNSNTKLSFEPLSHHLKHNQELKKYYNDGIEKGFIFPQLHGFCHFNLKPLNDFFQSDRSEDLFKLGFLTGESTIRTISNEFKGELIMQNNSIDVNLESSVNEFFYLFGFYPKTIIPPHFILDLKLLELLKQRGIECIQACNRLIKYNRNRIRKVFFRKQHGIYWFPRTARLDPHDHYSYFADQCLTSIEKAFNANIPAVIDFHRVNISGKYNSKYRDRTLKELDYLLKMVKKQWPDVHFVSTNELLKKVCQT